MNVHPIPGIRSVAYAVLRYVYDNYAASRKQIASDLPYQQKSIQEAIKELVINNQLIHSGRNLIASKYVTRYFDQLGIEPAQPATTSIATPPPLRQFKPLDTQRYRLSSEGVRPGSNDHKAIPSRML